MPDYLTLDIETIPRDTPELREYYACELLAKAQAATPPGNYKNPESIAKWKQEQLDNVPAQVNAEIARGSLTPHLAELAVIAYAVNGRPADCIRLDHSGDERAMLQQLDALLDGLSSDVVWVGYNILEFDLQVLAFAAMRYQLRQLLSRMPWRERPYSRVVYDVMHQLPAKGYRNFISCNDALQAFGLPLKTDDGGNVAAMWAAGKYDAVATYGMGDVERERLLFTHVADVDLGELQNHTIPA